MLYGNLSLAFFTSLKSAVVVTEEVLYKHEFDSTGLPGDDLYLTNLSQEEIDAIPIGDQDKQRLLPKGKLLVNPAYISKELGVDLERGDAHFNEKTLQVILQGYKSALFRIRFNINDISGDIRRALVEQIKARTMACDFREAHCQGIDTRKLNIGAHSWVETGARPRDGEYIRTVHLDRERFYYYLLSQELPVDAWESGDPSLPVGIIMRSTVGTGHGFISEGVHQESGSIGFQSGCTTSYRRTMYLPKEIVSLQEESAAFEMKGWWRGRMLRPSSPYDKCNSLSLADSIIMEMVYRSWRSQNFLGYWLAATERLIIHGVSELLSEDMKVIGYGSGKIAIATPKDELQCDRQDEALLKLSEDFHIRIPIDPAWSSKKICVTLPLLSDMQKIAVSSMKALADIDRAIDHHDDDSVVAAREDARTSLKEKIA